VSPVRFPIAMLGAMTAAALLPAFALADRSGQQVGGSRGDQQTTSELNADQLGRMPPREQPEERDETPPAREPNPDSPATGGGATLRRAATIRAATVSSAQDFAGPSYADSGAYPPDTMGDVGPSQYIAMINGRVRSYSKATAAPDGVVNTDTDVFWSSVMTPISPLSPSACASTAGAVCGNFTSDPHIRYDRLSQRWIAVMIDVPYHATPGDLSNRIMVAVSDSATITGTTVWHFFSFNAPSGEFADYPTLGIDANALYIGTNEFGASAAGPFVNTNAYVVQKSSILGGGPIHVTAFRNLLPSASGSGLFTPQGVDNPAPAAASGYFVGSDNRFDGLLDIRTVSDPGGTAPTLSSNVALTVPATAEPKAVPDGDSGANTGTLDGLDERLFAAQVRNGHLWTAGNIKVNLCGSAVSAASPPGCNVQPDRDAVRWYDIDVSGAPTLNQNGTIFDGASTNPRSYWMPTVAVNGQGAMTIAGSTGSAVAHADGWFASRRATDAANTLTAPTIFTSASAVNNPPYNPPYNRWGDYSMTSVDPTDDQTFWTIQEYIPQTSPPSSVTWGTRIAKLLAPAPAAPTGASPSQVPLGDSSVHVDLTGPANSGWFDPGSGFTKRLAVTPGCGIVVKSVTYNGPASIGLDLDTTAATRGTCDVRVTNPDGQSATATGLLATNTAPVGAADNYAATKDTELDGASVLANDTDADGDALTAVLVSGPAHGTLSLASNGTFAYTPTSGYSGPDSFTYKASDGVAQSAATTVSINVVDPASDRAPAGTADAYDVPHAGTLNAASVLANDSDPDGDALTAVLVSGPAHGTLTFASGGTFTYVADATSVGPDSFTYEATDGLLSSAPVTVTLTGPADQSPAGVADSYSVPSSGALTGSSVLANDTDPDSDLLTAVGVASPAHGTLTLRPNGTFDYQAEAGFSGADTFSYRASDGRLTSAETTVTLNVAAPSPPATGGGGGGGGGGSTGGTTSDTTTAPVAVLTPPSLTSGAVVPIVAPTTTQPKPASCVVPRRLRGHTVRYARRVLAKAHCAVGKVSRVRSKTVKRGRIVRTRPASRTVRPAGAKVAIQIRK
jgi:VCBS repeat-containing protein